jgi:FKBP-type peptidyl-prolyl cis-trans isomerase FklB
MNTRLTKNGMPDRVLAHRRNNIIMRIEMKLIQSAFLVATLLALNASAQPTPPSFTNRPPPTQPPNNRPSPRMPPGLMPGAPTLPPPPMPDKDKLSYAIGFFFGNQIKHDHLDLDMDTTLNAMKEVLAGQPTRMDEKEVQAILKQLQKALPAKMAAENKAKGDAFMAKNAKDPDVKTLTNGIQYKVLKEGAGEMPKTTDTVIVAYKGSLVDGTVFDEKAAFTNQVTGRTIKGWTEVLPLMKTGSKWEIVIPPDLGYAQRGFPPKIGPESVLIFDIELLAITAPQPPRAVPPGTPPAVPPAATLHPGPPTPTASNTTTVASGQILRVPSAEELKKGAKIEVITNVPNNQ